MMAILSYKLKFCFIIVTLGCGSHENMPYWPSIVGCKNDKGHSSFEIHHKFAQKQCHTGVHQRYQGRPVLGKNRILPVGYSWRQLCCLFFTCTFLFSPQLHSLSFSSLICTPGGHSLIPCHLTSSWVLLMRGGQDGRVGGEIGCAVSSFAHSLHWHFCVSSGISPWFQLLKVPLCACS